MGRKKTKHFFDETIETVVKAIVVDGEFTQGKQDREGDRQDFETYIDMFDSIRGEKDYDWMSDISVPEFPAHMLTQAAMDVSQYFASRDYVEVYMMEDTDEAKKVADAARECLNKTLNQRHLYHYLKYTRAKGISNLKGSVVLKCWWEQQTTERKTGERNKVVPLDVDVNGMPMTDPNVQVPATRTEPEDIIEEVPIVDRFNYEVWDPRNVFFDDKYVYSLQDKDWVILRSEATLQDLEKRRENAGYFNLHLLQDIKPRGKSDTRQETEVEATQPTDRAVRQYFDILERYGRFPCIVKDNGQLSPGYDRNHEIVKGAIWYECVITFATHGAQTVLIGFHKTPYVDFSGQPYRPIIRGLCYVHPVDDNGAGDGKYCREIQVAINDTFNVSNDRVMLATLPTMKGKKFALEDNDTLYFEPQHTIELNDPSDLEEFKITDNIQGALQQAQWLKGQMDQVTSIFPSTMGALPAESSTKATAIATSEQRSNMRGNYKSLTFENTALCEMYWMIVQMTYSFAMKQTAYELMGEKVYDFDPTKEYFYKPLSQALETEYSKASKIRNWSQIFAMVGQIAPMHKDGIKMINYVFGEMAKLMGDEFANFSRAFLDERQPMQEQQGGGQGSPPQVGGVPASNQQGIPMSTPEMETRANAPR